MATNFSPCKGSYVLNQFPSNVMFGMNGFHISASGVIQGHHGSLVCESVLGQDTSGPQPSTRKDMNNVRCCHEMTKTLLKLA